MIKFLSTDYKSVLGALAILVTFIAFIPYIWSILKGTTKPHVFSWVIWGVTTGIVCVAQIADNGGAGAWSIGVSGVITMGIALLAYMKKNDVVITRLDWLFFGLAIAAIPFWIMTDSPMGAVILLTTIDILGFLPTMRKAYINPYEEPILMYLIVTGRNIMAVLALTRFSVTTALFPIATGIVGVLLIGVIVVRRQKSRCPRVLEVESPGHPINIEKFTD